MLSNLEAMGLTEEIFVRAAVSSISGGAAAAWVALILGNRIAGLVAGFLVAIGVWYYDAMPEQPR